MTEWDITGDYDPPTRPEPDELDDEREAAAHGETLADDGTPGAAPPELGD